MPEGPANLKPAARNTAPDADPIAERHDPGNPAAPTASGSGRLPACLSDYAPLWQEGSSVAEHA